MTICWPGKVSGRPGRSSWSFAKATRLPEKLIEPIRAENMIPREDVAREAARLRARAGGTRPRRSSAAAPPPTPLKSATICGIAVIRTRRAEATPITVPTAIPAAISP